MEENRESEGEGTSDARTSTLAYAQARGKRRRAKRVANQALQAQADLVRAVQRAAEHGVTSLPALPPGVRASTGAMLEAMLTDSNGAKAYALAQRLMREAMDDSAPRSLDAARIVLERSEDPRVKRTETTQRSARIVLNVDKRQRTQGGTLETSAGPMLESQRTIDAPVSSLAPPSLLSDAVADDPTSSPVSGGGPAELAVLGERVLALEQGQQQVLGMLQKLLEATVAREGK